MQRVALINGTNKNQDYDLAKIFKSLAVSGIAEGLEVQSGKVTAGYALIDIIRDGKTFPILFENSTDLVINTGTTTKVYIEISQTNIDDGSNNSTDGTGIGSIKTGVSYPTSNFLKLANITGGVIIDERVFIDLRNESVTKQSNDFNGVKQLVKTDENGKIITGLLPELNPVVKSLQDTFIAGENIPAGDSVRMGTEISFSEYNLTSGAAGYNYDSTKFGRNTTYHSGGQSFVTTGARTLSEVAVQLSKVGTPSSSINAYLCNSSGTVIATSSTTISSGQVTNGAWINFAFNYSLSNSTQYRIKLSANSLNASHHYQWWQSSSANSPSREGDGYYVNSGGSWSTGSYASERNMKVFSKVVEDSTKIYKTDASNPFKLQRIGSVKDTVILGAAVIANIGGSEDNQTGLINGSEYFLSDTPGKIQATPGTYPKRVGIAINPTAILSEKSTNLRSEQSLSNNVEYTASADGIVTGYGENVSYYATNYMEGYRNGYILVKNGQINGTNLSLNYSVCFPVKRGDTYKIYTNRTFIKGYFTPLY